MHGLPGSREETQVKCLGFTSSGLYVREPWAFHLRGPSSPSLCPLFPHPRLSDQTRLCPRFPGLCGYRGAGRGEPLPAPLSDRLPPSPQSPLWFLPLDLCLLGPSPRMPPSSALGTRHCLSISPSSVPRRDERSPVRPPPVPSSACHCVSRPHTLWIPCSGAGSPLSPSKSLALPGPEEVARISMKDY